MKEGEGKLLLDVEDVAQAFLDYYTEFLLPSLKRDLGNRDFRAIQNYVEPQDEDRLPNPRTTPLDEMNSATTRMAEEVAIALMSARPISVAENIRSVLEAHYGTPLHMKHPSSGYGKANNLECSHMTQHAWLVGYSKGAEAEANVRLLATRGAKVCEEEPEKPWIFPGYRVLKLD